MPADDKETKPQVDYAALEQRVRASLAAADEYTWRNRKLNSTLSTIAIIGSALTAFLTTLTAAKGPVIIQGMLDWQGACSLGAIMSVTTTIASGLNQQMDISRRLMEGSQCVGRLRALELVVTTRARSAVDITAEYAEILRTYAEATR